MQLTILTPHKHIFEGDITSLTVPGSAGSFQILRDHAPIISSLGNGKVIYTNGDKKNELMIEQGLILVHDNLITLLVEL